ncbi:MAG: formyl transferase, partial [Candidatus Eremiobacterota bacterium]
TLMSSYTKLHKEIQNLLISNWEEIKNNRVTPEKHPEGGSIHYIKDFEQVKPLLSDKGWEIKIKELKERYKNLILNGDV